MLELLLPLGAIILVTAVITLIASVAMTRGWREVLETWALSFIIALACTVLYYELTGWPT